MSPRFNAILLGFMLILIPLTAGMIINKPEAGFTYRESVLNVNFTDNLTGSKTCYYSFGSSNYTITDCGNFTLEFPINSGDINLTLYEVNATHTHTDTAEITINNDFSAGKGVFLGFLLLVFLLLPFVFWYPCFKLDSLHTPIKFFLTVLGFFSGLVFLFITQVLISAYVHSGVLNSMLEAFIDGYVWIFYIIIVYFLITFLFSVFEYFKLRRSRR